MTTTPTVAEQLERLASEAAKTADDIAYYSGGSKHNQAANDLTRLVMNNLPTILTALRTPTDQGELVERLRGELATVESERDEAVNWSQIVDRHGTDQFDDLAERWLAMESIRRIHQAMASVFAKHASEDIMQRFMQMMRDQLQIAFVEGCLVGVRATEAATALSPRPDAWRAGVEAAAKVAEQFAAGAGATLLTVRPDGIASAAVKGNVAASRAIAAAIRKLNLTEGA